MLDKLIHIVIVQGVVSLTHCDTDKPLNSTEPPDAILGILKNPHLYNRFLAPGQVLGRSTKVEVAIYFESMTSFKAQTMDFSTDMYLALLWKDQRLKHNSASPVLITDPFIYQRMWHPDLYFVNSKRATLQTVTTPNFMLMVYNDGFVFQSLRVAVTLSCMMNFENFPLDEQECPIFIQSFAYVETLLNLTWFENSSKKYPINYNDRIKLNDMSIIGSSYTYCSGPYPMLRGSGNWSCLMGVIKMKRMVMFHVFQTYIPTAMLVSISWLSFWLDIKASPARISLTITTLLTLTTMSVGAKQGLPQVSYVKAIDIWLNMCTGFVYSVLLEYTLVCFYVGRKTTGCRLHVSDETSTFLLHNGRVSNTGQLKVCGVCTSAFEKRARSVDIVSRGLFPSAFTVFSTVYWWFYLSKYWSSPT